MRQHATHRVLGLLAAVVISISASTAARADISWTLNTEFSGAQTPSGPVYVTLTDVAAGQVKLEVSNGFASASEFISGLYLNYNGGASGLSFTSFAASPVGSVTEPAENLGTDLYKADGDGFFDIQLVFANSGSGRFQQGESISYLITGSGISAAGFSVLSLGGGNSPSGLYAAAHVQGIGENGGGSGWVTVPEPSTYIAGALLLLPFGVSALRVLRKKSC